MQLVFESEIKMSKCQRHARFGLAMRLLVGKTRKFAPYYSRTNFR